MVQVFHALKTLTSASPSSPRLFPSINTLVRVYGEWLFAASVRTDESYGFGMTLL